MAEILKNEVVLYGCRAYPSPKAMALGAVEGQFLAILGKQVLPEKFAQVLEKITKPAQDRVIASNSLFGLGDVGDIHVDNRQYQQASDQAYDYGADLKKDPGKILQRIHVDVHRISPLILLCDYPIAGIILIPSNQDRIAAYGHEPKNRAFAPL
jgi:hypothetical protein